MTFNQIINIKCFEEMTTRAYVEYKTKEDYPISILISNTKSDSSKPEKGYFIRNAFIFQGI